MKPAPTRHSIPSQKVDCGALGSLSSFNSLSLRFTQLESFLLSLKDSERGYESVPVQTKPNITKRVPTSLMKKSLLTTLASAAPLAAALTTHAQH